MIQKPFKLLLVLVLALAFMALSPVKKLLLKSDSSVSFKLNTDLTNVTGKINDYQGKLFLDTKDFSKSKLIFTVNINKFSLTGNVDPSLALASSLLSNLEVEPASFESESIIPQKDGQYLIKGVVERSNKKWEMSLLAKPEKLKNGQTKIKFQMNGDFSGSEFNIPLEGDAEVLGEVVFAAPKAIREVDLLK